MPIYAYKCGTCGHAKDVLQKVSDPSLRDCPACGAASFNKQVTAAGFQLKGSGWYATDFRGSSSNPPAPASADTAKTDAVSKPAQSGTSSGTSNTSNTSGSGSKSDGPVAAAKACAGCACH